MRNLQFSSRSWRRGYFAARLSFNVLYRVLSERGNHCSKVEYANHSFAISHSFFFHVEIPLYSRNFGSNEDSVPTNRSTEAVP